MRTHPEAGGGLALTALWLSNLATAQTGKPPPEVSVVEVARGTIPLTFEYAGRVEASREVQVRAQASGILLRRHFVEGAEVKAGDILFSIDAKTYAAELARAQAQLKQAQAQLSQATRDVERYSKLAQTGSGTERAREDALSAQELAEASVAIAQAGVAVAEIFCRRAH